MSYPESSAPPTNSPSLSGSQKTLPPTRLTSGGATPRGGVFSSELNSTCASGCAQQNLQIIFPKDKKLNDTVLAIFTPTELSYLYKMFKLYGVSGGKHSVLMAKQQHRGNDPANLSETQRENIDCFEASGGGVELGDGGRFGDTINYYEMRNLNCHFNFNVSDDHLLEAIQIIMAKSGNIYPEVRSSGSVAVMSPQIGQNVEENLEEARLRYHQLTSSRFYFSDVILYILSVSGNTSLLNKLAATIAAQRKQKANATASEESERPKTANENLSSTADPLSLFQENTIIDEFAPLKVKVRAHGAIPPNDEQLQELLRIFDYFSVSLGLYYLQQQPSENDSISSRTMSMTSTNMNVRNLSCTRYRGHGESLIVSNLGGAGDRVIDASGLRAMFREVRSSCRRKAKEKQCERAKAAKQHKSGRSSVEAETATPEAAPKEKAAEGGGKERRKSVKSPQVREAAEADGQPSKDDAVASDEDYDEEEEEDEDVYGRRFSALIGHERETDEETIINEQVQDLLYLLHHDQNEGEEQNGSGSGSPGPNNAQSNRTTASQRKKLDFSHLTVAGVQKRNAESGNNAGRHCHQREYITFAEFVTLMCIGFGRPGADVSNEEDVGGSPTETIDHYENIEELMLRLFYHYDTAGNGYISTDALRKIVKNLTRGFLPESEINELVDAAVVATHGDLNRPPDPELARLEKLRLETHRGGIKVQPTQSSIGSSSMSACFYPGKNANTSYHEFYYKQLDSPIGLYGDYVGLEGQMSPLLKRLIEGEVGDPNDFERLAFSAALSSSIKIGETGHSAEKKSAATSPARRLSKDNCAKEAVREDVELIEYMHWAELWETLSGGLELTAQE